MIELRDTAHTTTVPYTQGSPEIADLANAGLAVGFSLESDNINTIDGSLDVANQGSGDTVNLEDVVSVATDGTDITLTVDTSALNITAATEIYCYLSITQPD